jgi:DNA polymerase elongation subunit (family B)
MNNRLDFSTVLCEHSHTIERHPACFLRMLGRFKGKDKPDWYNKAHIGYLDIETANLKPDFSCMLSWCVKNQGGDVAWDMMKAANPFNGDPDTDFHWDRQDKRIVATLGKELIKYDVIITYYGSRFDLPFTRSRTLYWKLPFLGYGGVYHLDMYYVVKNKLNLSSNRLENACDFLGIKGKTPIKKQVWREAHFGRPEALEEILEHNIADVSILEELHLRLEPYLRGTKTSI